MRVACTTRSRGRGRGLGTPLTAAWCTAPSCAGAGATRKFVLSSSNPNYYVGGAAAGLGSNHTGPGMVWPLGLVMQGMTADTHAEALDVLAVRSCIGRNCSLVRVCSSLRKPYDGHRGCVRRGGVPQTLVNTTAGTMLMHESFNASQPAQYTRAKVRPAM